jgi:translation initiation factor RLI1
MESIFGGLIEFESEKDFDEFLQNMNKSEAISIIEKAIEFSYQQNVYSVQETYFIYKSLKKLKQDYGLNSRNGELQQG